MEITFNTETASFGELAGLFQLIEAVLDDRNPGLSHSLLEGIYHVRNKNKD